MYTYIPKNVCSRKIMFDVIGGKISSCEFVGGCTGNTQGLSKLVVGLTPSQVIDRLRGIQCRNGTSWPDQLAEAMQKYLDENK